MLNNKRKYRDNYEVASVRKALEILCEFNDESAGLSLSELSRRLDLPKSTTHNLLRTLQSYDFIKQDPADKRYRLGPRVFELGLRFSHGTRLVSIAGSYMRRLADRTKETVKLGILSNMEVLILAAFESPYQLHTRGDEGRRAPLHCTGLGKAILAVLGHDEVRHILDSRGLPRFTRHTIGDREILLQELCETRTRGYALDIEENEEGVVCAAAAIPDLAHGTVAALSVSAPATRLEREQLVECAELVARTAGAISASLKDSSAARRAPLERKELE